MKIKSINQLIEIIKPFQYGDIKIIYGSKQLYFEVINLNLECFSIYLNDEYDIMFAINRMYIYKDIVYALLINKEVSLFFNINGVCYKGTGVASLTRLREYKINHIPYPKNVKVVGFKRTISLYRDIYIPPIRLYCDPSNNISDGFNKILSKDIKLDFNTYNEVPKIELYNKMITQEKRYVVSTKEGEFYL